jgi:hypothetical protein
VEFKPVNHGREDLVVVTVPPLPRLVFVTTVCGGWGAVPPNSNTWPGNSVCAGAETDSGWSGAGNSLLTPALIFSREPNIPQRPTVAARAIEEMISLISVQFFEGLLFCMSDPGP